jgi:hypothetical protein
MIDIALRAFSLAMTIGVLALAFKLQHSPTAHGRTVETISSIVLLMAVPMVIVVCMLMVRQKWEGVFFICTLANVFAVAVVAGYFLGIHTKHDAFETAIGAGMLSLIVAGGPLAAYFLP